MKKTIKEVLYQLEVAEKLTVLFAVESGSRAWSFASEDSDYDVKFVYARRVDDYLSVWDRKDTLSVNESVLGRDIELVGWDVKKLIPLALKSNPQVVEWAQAALDPRLCYIKTDWTVKFLEFMWRCLNFKSLGHHYASMAHKNWKTFWEKNGKRLPLQEPVRIKKYLHTLRPLFAIEYMYLQVHPPGSAGPDSSVIPVLPPLNFYELSKHIPVDKVFFDEFSSLLDMKSRLTGNVHSRFSEIEDWMWVHYFSGHGKADRLPVAQESNVKELADPLFRSALKLR